MSPPDPSPTAAHERILVVDFGSQYAQLIARRVREAGVYAEIVPASVTPEQARGSKGVILSGGPASVYGDGAPRCDPGLFEAGVPVLGICYGMQLLSHLTGGRVTRADRREYGPAVLHVRDRGDLFRDLPDRLDVWMSHGDRVVDPGPGFKPQAISENSPFAAVRHATKPLWGIQFHPEVTHTPRGGDILRNFLYGVCGCSGDWQPASFIEESVAAIRRQVGDAGRVVCGLSGGVDSAVAAALVHRAIGDRLTAIFVDNGLLRAGEAEEVLDAFRARPGIRLAFASAGARFLDALRGVVDPEEKRRRIGHVFVDVFEDEARKIEGAHFLAQGTLYPDVIESRSPVGGPSATIKTHHNVGGLPADLGFALVEPLRDLFKDEVRRIGRALGLPDAIVDRQPFPGPGLAVRILGAVTPEALATLRLADGIVRDEIHAAGLHHDLWQYFAVLLPVKSVGVMGDERAYGNVVAVRAVRSEDGMTADWADLPSDAMRRLSARIVNEVPGVNRVVYDVSSKPPATIEWE